MSSEADVCFKCSDNFIVNAKFSTCERCKKKYHLMCVSLKDTWYKTLLENENIIWVCNPCIVDMKSSLRNSVSKDNESEKILAKEIQCLTREKNLMQKLLSELEYTVELQKSVISSQEAQLNSRYKNVNIRVDESNHDRCKKIIAATDVIPQNSNDNKTKQTVIDPVTTNPKSKQTKGIEISDHNSEYPPVKMVNKKITSEDVNRAVKSAQDSLKSDSELRNQDAKIVNHKGIQKNPDSEWKIVNNKKTTKKRSRPALVVGNFTGDSIVQGVEKSKILHVSNLSPSTTQDDMQKFLEKKFKRVKCEPLVSRYPQSYASFKVVVPLSEYDEALKAENWPKYASIHNFFHFSTAKKAKR